MTAKYRLLRKEIVVSVLHTQEKKMDDLARAKIIIQTTQQLCGT